MRNQPEGVRAVRKKKIHEKMRPLFEGAFASSYI